MSPSSVKKVICGFGLTDVNIPAPIVKETKGVVDDTRNLLVINSSEDYVLAAFILANF